MSSALQLSLPLATPQELVARLRQLGLSPAVPVTLHHNRAVMVTVGRRGTLRVHAGYAHAPDQVLHAIVRWCRPRLPRAVRRAAARILLGFPVHRSLAPEPARPPDLRDPADAATIARLERLHAELSQRCFAGSLRSIPIRLSRRMRRKLGHYEPGHGGPGLIVISRRHLRRHGWQQVTSTLLHEMVHQWQDETGRRLDHGPAFRRKAREVGIAPRAVADLR